MKSRPTNCNWRLQRIVPRHSTYKRTTPCPISILHCQRWHPELPWNGSGGTRPTKRESPRSIQITCRTLERTLTPGRMRRRKSCWQTRTGTSL
jgi:hypothetical protein